MNINVKDRPVRVVRVAESRFHANTGHYNQLHKNGAQVVVVDDVTNNPIMVMGPSPVEITCEGVDECMIDIGLPDQPIDHDSWLR